MSQTRNSAISLLAVIALLALTALATLLYSGNKEQKAKADNNIFLKKTRLVFDFSLQALQGITDLGMNNSQHSLSSIDSSNKIDVNKIQKTNGFMSGMKKKAQQAWNENDSKNNLTNNPDSSNLNNFISWKSVKDGAQIIFRSKDGKDYKMFLPLRFLSK